MNKARLESVMSGLNQYASTTAEDHFVKTALEDFRKNQALSPSMIILATKDESHSTVVNPNSIESLILPFVEDEVKKNLKS